MPQYLGPFWPNVDSDGSYYRARYYDAATGTFLSEDPVRFGIGAMTTGYGPRGAFVSDYGTLGRTSDFYSYAGNSPLDKSDPTGRWQVTIGGGLDVGGLLTLGYNDGQWNAGIRGGAGEGGFLSIDPEDNPDCDCGFGYGLQGDIGLIENVGITMNQNQGNPPEMSIDYTDPNGITWSWSPLNPEQPVQPSIGFGAGFFAGVGYTWCF